MLAFVHFRKVFDTLDKTRRPMRNISGQFIKPLEKTKTFYHCVLPISTFGQETLTLTRKTATQMRMDRYMLELRFPDRVRSEEISRTGFSDSIDKRARQVEMIRTHS